MSIDVHFKIVPVIYSFNVIYKVMVKTFNEWLLEMVGPTQPDKVKHVLILADNGETLSNIARETGLTFPTIKAILKKHMKYGNKTATPGYSQLPSIDVINKILAGHDEGYSDEELAQIFKLTSRDIRSIIVTNQPTRSPQLRKYDFNKSDVMPIDIPPKTHNRLGKKLLSDDQVAGIIQAGTQEYLNDLEIMRKFKVGRSSVRQLLAPYITPEIAQKRKEHNYALFQKSGGIRK
jgi:hypothetical protein